MWIVVLYVNFIINDLRQTWHIDIWFSSIPSAQQIWSKVAKDTSLSLTFPLHFWLLVCDLIWSGCISVSLFLELMQTVSIFFTLLFRFLLISINMVITVWSKITVISSSKLMDSKTPQCGTMSHNGSCRLLYYEISSLMVVHGR